MKQLGLGFMQYTQDYDEAYPPFYDSNLASGWQVMVMPYIKSEQLFQCPSESHGPDWSVTDYSYNQRLGYADSTYKGLKISAVTSTTRTVLACEYVGLDSRTSYASSGGCDQGGCGSDHLAVYAPDANAPAQRHLGGQNTLLSDGHVKWYKGATDNKMASIYDYLTTDANTPASVNSPTFNWAP